MAKVTIEVGSKKYEIWCVNPVLSLKNNVDSCYLGGGLESVHTIGRRTFSIEGLVDDYGHAPRILYSEATYEV